MAYRITLIPGDGTGPEITAATKVVIEVTGVAIDLMCTMPVLMCWPMRMPLPTRCWNQSAGMVALKGPITTSIRHRICSVNVALRQALNLYALCPAV